MLNRLCMLLALLLMLCSLGLVKSQYRSRQDFIQLGKLQSQARQFEIDWAQLQLDQSTLGKNARIEQQAEKLDMSLLTPAKTQYIKQQEPK